MEEGTAGGDCPPIERWREAKERWGERLPGSRTEGRKKYGLGREGMETE